MGKLLLLLYFILSVFPADAEALIYTLAAAPCPTLVGGTAEAVVCGYSGVISTPPPITHTIS